MIVNAITAPQRYYLIKPTLEEHVVWECDFAPAIAALPDNVRNIWEYAFTEIFNNAIDHSDGTLISASLAVGDDATKLVIGDDGEGVFRRMQRILKLQHARDSLLELSKGRVTTDPTNHSGEGIFFTSRMMDTFCILSRGLVFLHDLSSEDDWLVRAKNVHGTHVIMQLSNSADRRTTDVFSAYESTDGDHRFSKTVVPVRLASEQGKSLVSRSQAKRLVARLEKFEHIVLDFSGVTQLGQGFADQVFRVFASSQPATTIEFINANTEIIRVIAHVISAKKQA